MLFLVILALPGSAIAKPLKIAVASTYRHYKPNCSALIEDKPWKVTDLVTFAAKSSPECQSYVFFNFTDVNKGLELSTTCSHYLPLGSTSSVINDTYIPCANEDVNFKFLGNSIQLERWYEDPCLGKDPYDSAIAYGRSNISLTKTEAIDGVFATQTKVEVPISSLS